MLYDDELFFCFPSTGLLIGILIIWWFDIWTHRHVLTRSIAFDYLIIHIVISFSFAFSSRNQVNPMSSMIVIYTIQLVTLVSFTWCESRQNRERERQRQKKSCIRSLIYVVYDNILSIAERNLPLSVCVCLSVCLQNIHVR